MTCSKGVEEKNLTIIRNVHLKKILKSIKTVNLHFFLKDEAI